MSNLNNVLDFPGLNLLTNFIYEPFVDAITAATPATQAAATQLSAPVNRIVTNAAAGNGVKLPATIAAVSFMVIVTNSHATNAAQAYGLGTDTINGVAFATGVSIPATKTATFISFGLGVWHMSLSA